MRHLRKMSVSTINWSTCRFWAILTNLLCTSLEGNRSSQAVWFLFRAVPPKLWPFQVSRQLFLPIDLRFFCQGGQNTAISGTAQALQTMKIQRSFTKGWNYVALGYFCGFQDARDCQKKYRWQPDPCSYCKFEFTSAMSHNILFTSFAIIALISPETSVKYQ